MQVDFCNGCKTEVYVCAHAILSSPTDTHTHTHTHTHTRLTALFSGTTQVSRYQKGKTNLDFSETRDSE